MTAPDGSPPPAEPRSAWQRWRLVAVVALFAALWLVGDATGVIDRFDQDEVRRMVADAGPWGILLFVAVFTAGELLHVPGMVFIAAAILAWGQLTGFFVALGAAVVSVSVSFVVVRAIGGKALARIERPLMKKLLARLHARPVLTIVTLRAVFWLSPPLNYALAMTDLRFRDYLVGSAIGLVIPILGAAFLFDLIFQ